jgi:signal transduction histidine kinase
MSESELDRVISFVSHELRTPIAAILGYVEELRDEGPGPLTDVQRTFLEVVDRNGRRLLSLVTDLLFVAQADAGRTAFSRERVDLMQVASDAVASVGPAAAAKNVELSTALDGAVVVDGEPERLAQAADSLVANAVKITPENGRVDVRVAAQEREGVLEVRDTSIGTAPEELPSLSGPFYRTVAASVAGVPGTGLGLAVARAIVEGHGGRVEVESDGETGTLFRVRLPLTEEGG